MTPRGHLTPVPPLEMAPAQTERYHRLRGLAKVWGCSEALLRKEINAGRLPCHRIGRVVIISESDAAAFLAARRRGAQR